MRHKEQEWKACLLGRRLVDGEERDFAVRVDLVAGHHLGSRHSKEPMTMTPGPVRSAGVARTMRTACRTAAIRSQAGCRKEARGSESSKARSSGEASKQRKASNKQLEAVRAYAVEAGALEEGLAPLPRVELHACSDRSYRKHI